MDEFRNDLDINIDADLQSRITRVLIAQTAAPTALIYLTPHGMRELAATLIDAANKVDEVVDLEELFRS
jgi:hypothetical protein